MTEKEIRKELARIFKHAVISKSVTLAKASAIVDYDFEGDIMDQLVELVMKNRLHPADRINNAPVIKDYRKTTEKENKRLYAEAEDKEMLEIGKR